LLKEADGGTRAADPVHSPLPDDVGEAVGIVEERGGPVGNADSSELTGGEKSALDVDVGVDEGGGDEGTVRVDLRFGRETPGWRDGGDVAALDDDVAVEDLACMDVNHAPVADG
jgi:hypothetical protein